MGVLQGQIGQLENTCKREENTLKFTDLEVYLEVYLC